MARVAASPPSAAGTEPMHTHATMKRKQQNTAEKEKIRASSSPTSLCQGCWLRDHCDN